MAKYTLNVSEICEQVSGLKFNEMSGLPFDIIDDIANASIPKIFSDRYDLLDNGDDRIDLLRMILEHYWEYEICTYTPSDFILRINRKLNEIAPYYNKRYESTKLEFPIFEDIDYTDDGTDGHTQHTQDTGLSNTKHSDKDVTTTAHTGDIVVRMDEDGSTTVTGNILDVEKHTGDIEVNSQESGTTKNVGSNDTTQKHTGTVKNDSKESGTTKSVTDRTETDAGHTTYHDEKIHDTDYKYHTENRKTDWDYNNDTPQGSISGITENDYLTGYSKHTSEYGTEKMNFSLSASGSFFDGESYSYTTDDSNMDKYNVLDTSGDFKTDAVKDTTEGTTSIDDSNTVTHGKGVDQTTTYNDTITTNTNTTDTTTHGKGNNQVTEYGDTITTDNDSTNTTAFGKGQTDKTDFGDTVTATTDYGHNIKTDTEGTKDFKHDGEYHKHVIGKYNSSKTYAQMLTEYRETMINIYNEIIDELRELFFIIY